MKYDSRMTPREIVVAFFVEGYTNRNYEFVMDCMADDYIDNSPAGARSNADAVGILKIVAGQYAYLNATVIDAIAEGDMVATRVRFDGLHNATGKQISFEGLENFKVVDGKIVESWGYWPDKAIEEQLNEE